MELYQFLLALFIIYYLNLYYFFLLIFSFLMLRHFYKKNEKEEKNKIFVKCYKYPIFIYSKLKSYNYDYFIFRGVNYVYNRINLIYNYILDEVFLMFSDLFYEIVNQNIKNNSINPDNNIINLLNCDKNIMENLVHKFTNQNDKILESNDNILNKIKKINKYEEKDELDKILDDEIDNFFKNEKDLKESLNNLALKFNYKKNL